MPPVVILMCTWCGEEPAWLTIKMQNTEHLCWRCSAQAFLRMQQDLVLEDGQAVSLVQPSPLQTGSDPVVPFRRPEAGVDGSLYCSACRLRLAVLHLKSTADEGMYCFDCSAVKVVQCSQHEELLFVQTVQNQTTPAQ